MNQQHPILHLLFLGMIYAAAGWWFENTGTGKWLKHFLQTWRADGWVHGIMCSISVYILLCCAILSVGLLQMYLR